MKKETKEQKDITAIPVTFASYFTSKIYGTHGIYQTGFDINESTEGETIEQKIDRVVNNNEPIEDGAPIIYEERNAGVNPAHDIRADRFELALDATDHMAKQHLAERKSRIELREAEKQKGKGEGGKEGGEGQHEGGGEGEA